MSSVLESMRSGTDSTFMQLVFAAVVVSFIGWGVGVSGNTTSTVATVNGEGISNVEFSRIYRNAEQRFSAGSKTPMTEDDRAELRERVLQDLIRQKALLQEAKALGLEVSNVEVAEQLYEYEFLLDEDGRFDQRAYQNFLRRQGITRANFEEQIRDELLTTKLQGLMILGASVSAPMVERKFLEDNTKFDISYVRLRVPDFEKSIDPTPEEIATWVAEHPDEIKGRYDDDFSRLYDQPEKVALREIQLTLRDDGLAIADLKKKLETVKAELDAGGDFATLAARWSEAPSAADGGLLPSVPTSTLDDEVQQALVGLEPGGLTKIVVNERRVAIFTLVERTEAREIPLEDVQDDIAAVLLRESEAPVRMARFAEQELLPAWKAQGAPPTELLDGYGITVRTTGLVSTTDRVLFRPPEAMTKLARTAEVGEVFGEVFEEGGDLYVGALTAREDADMTEFEENRDKYREGALLDRRVSFFQGWVDDVVARATVQR